MTDPLVSTDWLGERIGRADIQIIDASWHMPADQRDGRAEYAAGHIPGAVFFDIDALSDRATDLPHMLLSPEAFAEAAGRLGLRREATVVVYDSEGVFSAPRVWWTLRTMGFEDVFVLNGGLKAWRAQGREIETGEPETVVSVVTPVFHSELVRTLADVSSLLTTRAAQIVDARPAARFRGETAEPRAGLRSGHMPGALNVPFNLVVAEDGRLKDADTLRGAFEAAGVDLAAPIATTCGSGITASVLALALACLGRDDVAVYDGSWSEWGGRTDVPVVTGA